MTSDDNFYLSKDEPHQSCLLALRDIVLNMDEDVSETKKYGMPCFCYRNKMFCYLWTDKNTQDPYILFVEGKHLDHPDLESGERARMKILKVDPNKDIPLKKVKTLLNIALELYRSGVIKTN
ncbi:MAG: DUF1801 domain-containing protein [Flavobacteriales bacterium]|nr:DUF1801 domain-containing protein [Flavobacteriales bacterium]